MAGKTGKRIQSSVFILTQEPEHLPFNNLDGGTTNLQNTRGYCSAIWQILANAGVPLKHIAGITHDQDVKIESDKQFTAKHVHLHIWLEWEKRQDLQKISRILNIAPQYFENLKRGRYGRENALAYLIHAKQPEKHQYKSSEVCCENSDLGLNGYSNGWYQVYYSANKVKWNNFFKTVQNAEAEEAYDAVVDDILHGRLTYSEFIGDQNNLLLYTNHRDKIDNAFHAYGEYKAQKTINLVKNGKLVIRTFFITGKSGNGKTKFSNEVIKALLESHPTWSLYDGAGTNPFDDYHGEEIIRLDDLRGNSMEASDWLKLMDPYNVTRLSARYHNKTPAQRILFITSTQDPYQFFSFAKNAGGMNEALDQFIRRIQNSITIIADSDYEKYLERLKEAQKLYPATIMTNPNNSFIPVEQKRADRALPMIRKVNDSSLVKNVANKQMVSTNAVMSYYPDLNLEEIRYPDNNEPKIVLSFPKKVSDEFKIIIEKGKNDTSDVVRNSSYVNEIVQILPLSVAIQRFTWLVESLLNNKDNKNDE